jgi:hypothetical protein
MRSGILGDVIEKRTIPVRCKPHKNQECSEASVERQILVIRGTAGGSPARRVRGGPLGIMRWNAAIGRFRKVRYNQFPSAVPIRSPAYQGPRVNSW